MNFLIFLVHGELDTGIGGPSYVSALMVTFIGLQCDKHDKLQCTVRGKKTFPVTTDGLLSFNIKGRCDADKEFKVRKSRGAAEFSWSIFNFQKDQDVRLRVGYEACEQKHLLSNMLRSGHPRLSRVSCRTIVWSMPTIKVDGMLELTCEEGGADLLETWDCWKACILFFFIAI